MGVTVVLCAVSAVLGAWPAGCGFAGGKSAPCKAWMGCWTRPSVGNSPRPSLTRASFPRWRAGWPITWRPPRCRRGTFRRKRDAIKTLIGDISHQTKTPIANLLLYAQLLGEQPLPPQGRDCAAALERQAEKLKTLIEALVKTSPPGERHPDLSACGGAPGPYAGTGGGGTPAQGGQEGDHTDPAAHPGPRRGLTPSGRRRRCATCWTTG